MMKKVNTRTAGEEKEESKETIGLVTGDSK